MIEIWINTLFILFLFGGITFLANFAQRQPNLRVLLYVVILALNGLLLLYPLLVIGADALPGSQDNNLSSEANDMSNETDEDTSISTSNAVGAVIIGLVASVASTLLLFLPVREFLARYFPRRSVNAQPIASLPLMHVLHGDEIEMDEMPSGSEPSPANEGFDPMSMMHLWALILVLYFIGVQLMSFFLANGLSGLAEDVQTNEHTLLSNLILLVSIPVIGVGLMTRRNPRETLARLGIRRVTWKTLLVSGVVTFSLLVMVVIVAGIWMSLVSEETFERQTEASEALSASVGSLGIAFLLALSAGIGEEIAFRGALQPIFGFWFTTFAFVIAHVQYTLTPATLIILIVTMVFGLIRKYMDTTTSIITHFWYNFIPLALSLIAPEALLSLLG